MNKRLINNHEFPSDTLVKCARTYHAARTPSANTCPTGILERPVHVRLRQSGSAPKQRPQPNFSTISHSFRPPRSTPTKWRSSSNCSRANASPPIHPPTRDHHCPPIIRHPCWAILVSQSNRNQRRPTQLVVQRQSPKTNRAAQRTPAQRLATIKWRPRRLLQVAMQPRKHSIIISNYPKVSRYGMHCIKYIRVHLIKLYLNTLFSLYCNV